MDILKLITGNKSLQTMLLNKFTGMADEQGIKKLFIDLSSGQPEITPVSENLILIDKIEHDFYKDFYNTHKHLLTQKLLENEQ